MENNHFLDEADLQVKKHRPTFLTVLCIITFIISGFLLLYYLYEAITFDPVKAEYAMEEALIAIQEMNDQMGSSVFGNVEDYKKSITEQIENHSILSIIDIISVLLSLLGAYMMFNLKKIGFHIYTVSKLVGISSIFIITLTPMINIGLVLIGILTLAFIIMYGVNLKHMK